MTPIVLRVAFVRPIARPRNHQQQHRGPGLMSGSLLSVLLAGTAAPPVGHAPPALTTVFTAGEKDESGFAINSFRIPGFVVANGTLLAFAEARLYSWEDVSPHHLVVKRSLDNGRSWGALQTVVAPGLFPSGGTAGPHGDVYFDPSRRIIRRPCTTPRAPPST